MQTDLSQLDRFDDDRTLAFFLLVFGVMIFLASYSYSESAAIWPRFIAACMIVGCLLVLFQHHLPDLLRRIVVEDFRAIDQDEDLRDQSAEQTGADAVTFDRSSAIFTTVLLVAFAVLVLIAGYVIATVFFVLVYGHYSDMEPKYTLGILIGCLGVFYFVAPGLNIPIFQGLLEILPEFEVGL